MSVTTINLVAEDFIGPSPESIVARKAAFVQEMLAGPCSDSIAWVAEPGASEDARFHAALAAQLAAVVPPRPRVATIEAARDRLPAATRSATGTALANFFILVRYLLEVHIASALIPSVVTTPAELFAFVVFSFTSASTLLSISGPLPHKSRAFTFGCPPDMSFFSVYLDMDPALARSTSPLAISVSALDERRAVWRSLVDPTIGLLQTAIETAYNAFLLDFVNTPLFDATITLTHINYSRPYRGLLQPAFDQTHVFLFFVLYFLQRFPNTPGRAGREAARALAAELSESLPIPAPPAPPVPFASSYNDMLSSITDLAAYNHELLRIHAGDKTNVLDSVYRYLDLETSPQSSLTILAQQKTLRTAKHAASAARRIRRMLKAAYSLRSTMPSALGGTGVSSAELHRVQVTTDFLVTAIRRCIFILYDSVPPATFPAYIRAVFMACFSEAHIADVMNFPARSGSCVISQCIRPRSGDIVVDLMPLFCHFETLIQTRPWKSSMKKPELRQLICGVPHPRPPGSGDPHQVAFPSQAACAGFLPSVWARVFEQAFGIELFAPRVERVAAPGFDLTAMQKGINSYPSFGQHVIVIVRGVRIDHAALAAAALMLNLTHHLDEKYQQQSVAHFERLASPKPAAAAASSSSTKRRRLTEPINLLSTPSICLACGDTFYSTKSVVSPVDVDGSSLPAFRMCRVCVIRRAVGLGLDTINFNSDETHGNPDPFGVPFPAAPAGARFKPTRLARYMSQEEGLIVCLCFTSLATAAAPGPGERKCTICAKVFPDDGSPCPTCTVALCSRCDDLHPGLLCRVALDTAPEGTVNVSTLLNEVRQQRCPGCAAPFTKGPACAHMHCNNRQVVGGVPGICGVHWCWTCGTEMTEGTGAHFRAHPNCTLVSSADEVRRMTAVIDVCAESLKTPINNLDVTAEVCQQAKVALQTDPRFSLSVDDL